MTTDVHDRVRRAFGDIIDATGDLGPCPAANDLIITEHGASRGFGRSAPRRAADGGSASRAHRSLAVAAGLLLVIGVCGIAWIAQRPDSSTAARGTIDLGPVARFEAGTVTTITDPPLFVVNDPSTGFTVFDARSTHRGCILAVNGPDTADTAAPLDPGIGFIDPCHGSTFDPAGNKLAGPAARSMDRYPVAVTDQHLVVDLSQPIPGDPATTPTYAGEDLDLTLPIVGRGWADSMDFSSTPDMNARLYTAWQTAIAACMHTRGFDDYQPVTYPPNGDFQDRVNPLDRRYAAVMGYHALPAEPDDPNTYTDDTYLAAGECANAAWPDTYGRIGDYTAVNDQLRNGLSAAIDGFPDSDVGRAVTARWAACMAERGYRFQSRDEPIGTYADRPTISQDEIATRLDDLDCDVAVGYTQAQHDWEQARIDAWRSDHRVAIDNALELKQLAERQLAEIDAEQHSAQD